MGPDVESIPESTRGSIHHHDRGREIQGEPPNIGIYSQNEVFVHNAPQ